MDLAITQVRAQLAEKQRQREKQQPPPPVEAPMSTPTTLPNYLCTLSSLYSILPRRNKFLKNKKKPKNQLSFS
jgi:hypothetical protein